MSDLVVVGTGHEIMTTRTDQFAVVARQFYPTLWTVLTDIFRHRLFCLLNRSGMGFRSKRLKSFLRDNF